MKLNLQHFRHLTPTDWRVLTAVEMGTKNHEVVPTPLIIQLSGLKTGGSGVNKSISTLAKAGLIARERNMKYDGYRLTYGGYDYLALHSHLKSGRVVHVGSQMGVGKESDIYLITSPISLTGGAALQTFTTSSLTPSTNPNNTPSQTPQHADLAQTILKIHRLGRTSFRTLKNNRAYHGSRTSGLSWQYLSRLSASKEFAAMTALHDAGFPTPRPIGQNRHMVVMSLVPGIPLRTVPLEAFGQVDASASESEQEEQKQKRDRRIAALFGRCIELALRLAEKGLIHGDLNEFNMLIENVPDPEALAVDQDAKEMVPHLIDFPQITSMGHPNAQTYFERDIQGIKSFFRKRYHFEVDSAGPTYKEGLEKLSKAEKAAKERGTADSFRLDVKIEAMGFTRKSKQARELEEYYIQSASQTEGQQNADDQPDESIEDELSEEDDEDNQKSDAQNNFTTLEANANIQDRDDLEDLWADVGDLSLDVSNKSEKLAQSSIPQRSQKSSKAAAGWSI